MENKLQKTAGTGLPVTETTTYNNYGKGVQVGHADTFAPTMNLIIAGADGKTHSISTEYFNVFIGFDPFSTDHFLVPKDRVLTEYITPEVRSRFAVLDHCAVAEIKQLPAIITDEYSKTTADGKNAAFAFVTDIRKQQNGVMIHFQRFYPIPLKVLLDNEFALGMDMGFESYRTHWTIKNINLLQVLQDAGIQMWG
jgi:hypothetical protein